MTDCLVRQRREVMRQTLELLYRVIDDPFQADEMRAEARRLAAKIDYALVFALENTSGRTPLPDGFRTPGYFRNCVEQDLRELFGGEPDGLEAIAAVMVRQCADQVDDQRASVDYRLEQFNSLGYLVNSMRHRNSPDFPDCCGDDEDDESIERSTNHGTHE